MSGVASNIIPAILFAIGMAGYVRYLIFTIKGKQANGLIVENEGVKRGTWSQYFMTITFTTEEQRDIRGRIPVGPFWAFKTGEKIAVLYKPRDPQKFIIRSTATALYPVALIIFSLLLMLV